MLELWSLRYSCRLTKFVVTWLCLLCCFFIFDFYLFGLCMSKKPLQGYYILLGNNSHQCCFISNVQVIYISRLTLCVESHDCLWKPLIHNQVHFWVIKRHVKWGKITYYSKEETKKKKKGGERTINKGQELTTWNKNKSNFDFYIASVCLIFSRFHTTAKTAKEASPRLFM